MKYAIEILERDRLNIRHTIRKMRLFSDEVQHDLVGKDLPMREIELQEAIAHLEGRGTQPTASNIDYTAALEGELDEWFEEENLELLETNSHELAVRLNAAIQKQHFELYGGTKNERL